MQIDLKVFISSDMNELDDERQAIINSIKDINLIPIYAEDFAPNPNTPSEVYLNELHNSNYIIFVFDKIYSSHVENEVIHAIKWSKPSFYFIRERDELDRDKLLNKLIKNIKKKSYYGKFSNIHELDKLTKNALMNQLVNQANLEQIDYSEIHDLSRKIQDENLLLSENQKNPSCSEAHIPTFWKNINGDLVAAFKSGILTIPTNTCTHIDFPSHLAFSQEIVQKHYIEDDINFFVGKCIVIDYSEMIKNNLYPYLDHSGYLKIEGNDEDEKSNNYIKIINKLMITLDSFNQKLQEDLNIKSIDSLKDYFILIYTGLDKYWNTEINYNEEWRYAYFLNPYLSTDLIDKLVKTQIKGIGSDTYRLENPLINLGKIQSQIQSTGFIELAIPKVIYSEFEKINKNNLLHYKFLSKNIFLIENLTNLECIKNTISLFLALPPRVQLKCANTDMFVRAIAFRIKNPVIPD